MTSFAPGTDPKVIKSVNDRWLANQQEGLHSIGAVQQQIPRSRTKVFKPTRNQQHNRMKTNQRNIRGQQDRNFGIYTRPPSPLPGSGGTTVTEMGEMTYDGPITYSGLVGGKLKSLTKKQFDRMNSKTRPKPKTPRAPSHGDPPPKIGRTRGDLYAPGYMGGPTDAPIPIPGYGPKHPMWKGPRHKPIRGKPRPIRSKPIRGRPVNSKPIGNELRGNFYLDMSKVKKDRWGNPEYTNPKGFGAVKNPYYGKGPHTRKPIKYRPIKGKPIRGINKVQPIRPDIFPAPRDANARKLLALRNNQIKKKLALRNKQIKKKLVARNQLIKTKLEKRNKLIKLKLKGVRPQDGTKINDGKHKNIRSIKNPKKYQLGWTTKRGTKVLMFYYAGKWHENKVGRTQ